MAYLPTDLSCPEPVASRRGRFADYAHALRPSPPVKVGGQAAATAARVGRERAIGDAPRTGLKCSAVRADAIRRTSAMRARRLLPLLAAVAACALSAPRPAAAAESPVPTAQQKAYGMDWVPFIDPADLPPVEQRKVVCLVDSGVAITEDLPPDRPEGPIVQRIAVDGGSGLPGPKPEQQHGTQMASFAGAVMGNDWGTVGAWPGVRILSVRAMRYDATGFASSDWRRGIAACRVRSATLPVAVINLSFGGAIAISDTERARLEDYVGGAHQSNINVVAAAGNRGLNTLDAPANVAGVLPIAAGSTTDGRLCGYASHTAAILVGPGCSLDWEVGGVPARTDGGGSSSATAFTSTLVALLRSLYVKKYDRDADWEDVEGWLRETAYVSSNGYSVNGERAARMAGLGDVVDRARARIVAPQERVAEPPTAPAAAAPGPAAADSPGAVVTPSPIEAVSQWNVGSAAERSPDRLPRPKATANWRAGRLQIVLQSWTAFAGKLRVYTRSIRGKATVVKTFRRQRDRRFVLRVRRKPYVVRLQLLPFSGDNIDRSSPLTLRLAPRGYG
jgi:hypothetical protein